MNLRRYLQQKINEKNEQVNLVKTAEKLAQKKLRKAKRELFLENLRVRGRLLKESLCTKVGLITSALVLSLGISSFGYTIYKKNNSNLEQSIIDNETALREINNPEIEDSEPIRVIPELEPLVHIAVPASKNPTAPTKPTLPKASFKISDLVSNEFFRDSGYLTKEQIAKILKSKGSCLVGLGIEGTIIQYAQRYDINPLLILTRLQVEKGLLTKSKVNPKQLKYATGYGCFDNGKKLPSRGIQSQIKNTARTLDKHYDEFQGQKIRIDYEKNNIQPINAGTYALLRYTPHTQGAKLNHNVLKGLTNYPGLNSTNRVAIESRFQDSKTQHPISR